MFSQLVERESWNNSHRNVDGGSRDFGTTLVEPSLDINGSNFLLVYNYLVLFLFLFLLIEKLSNGF
jgi:hypothetical protein